MWSFDYILNTRIVSLPMRTNNLFHWPLKVCCCSKCSLDLFLFLGIIPRCIPDHHKRLGKQSYCCMDHYMGLYCSNPVWICSYLLESHLCAYQILWTTIWTSLLSHLPLYKSIYVLNSVWSCSYFLEWYLCTYKIIIDNLYLVQCCLQ